MLRMNKIIDKFEYTGEFLDKTDLQDLISNQKFGDFQKLVGWLEDGASDIISELANSKVNIYYYDLRKWSVDNYSYIEDAIQEFGVDTENPDFHKMIQSGQYYAYSNEFYTLVSEFKDYIEANYKF
jgi:hypothetical protein